MHFGRSKKAMETYAEFLQLAKTMADLFPNNVKARRDHAMAHLKLGMAQQSVGQECVRYSRLSRTTLLIASVDGLSEMSARHHR